MMLLPGELGEAPRQAKKIRMNITLRKIRQINVDDAARKHAQALPVLGIRLPESADAEFTAVRRRARALLQPEQHFRRQRPNMVFTRTGMQGGLRKSFIAVRSSES